MSWVAMAKKLKRDVTSKNYRQNLYCSESEKSTLNNPHGIPNQRSKYRSYTSHKIEPTKKI